MSYQISVLVCDNEPDYTQYAVDQISELLPEGSVATVGSAQEAVDLIDRRFFDIAFVDYKLSPRDRQTLGLDVLRHLSARAPSCKQVLMTKFAREGYEDVFDLGFPKSQGNQTFLLNKTDELTNYFTTIIKALFERELSSEWTHDSVDALVANLLVKGKRIDGRRDPVEVAAELRRIIFDIFHSAASVKLAGEAVRLEIVPMKPGASASVVATARPNYGVNPDGVPIYGNRCVLKIGPRENLVTEASRFNSIKLGLTSNFRVEMIGNAWGDQLAGVCYSFAGGTESDTIKSFDDVLSEGDVGEAAGLIDQLFSLGSKRWYSIKGASARPAEFYSSNFKVKFAAQVEDVHNFLRRAHKGKFDAEKGVLELPGLALSVPIAADLGRGGWQRARETCMIHGDLHGGNVLVDGLGQVCLIDYGTAGLGPRFADGAALGATLRLNGLEDSDTAFSEASKAWKADLAILRNNSTPQQLSHFDKEPWFPLARQLSEKLISNFADSPDDSAGFREELALVQLVYCLSVFSIPRWNRTQRMRLVVWMAACRKFLGWQDE